MNPGRRSASARNDLGSPVGRARLAGDFLWLHRRGLDAMQKKSATAKGGWGRPWRVRTIVLCETRNQPARRRSVPAPANIFSAQLPGDGPRQDRRFRGHAGVQAGSKKAGRRLLVFGWDKAANQMRLAAAPEIDRLGVAAGLTLVEVFIEARLVGARDHDPDVTGLAARGATADAGDCRPVRHVSLHHRREHDQALSHRRLAPRLQPMSFNLRLRTGRVEGGRPAPDTGR